MELIETTSVDEADPIWASLKLEAGKSLLKFKIGAAIIKRGRLLCVGHNTLKTHPKFGSKKNFMTMHAEGNSLFNAKKLGIDVKGAIMLVYRRSGLNSKPCESCQKLIEKSGIRKVVYTNEPRHN